MHISLMEQCSVEFTGSWTIIIFTATATHLEIACGQCSIVGPRGLHEEVQLLEIKEQFNLLFHLSRY